MCALHLAMLFRSRCAGLTWLVALGLDAPASTLLETRLVGDERLLLGLTATLMERLERCGRSTTVLAQRSQPTGAVEY